MEEFWNMKSKDNEDFGPVMMAGSSDDSRVSVEYNKIYFYSGVTRQDNLQLNKLIHTTSHKLKNIENLYKLQEAPKLNLHINSYGGSVFAGFSSVDYIRNAAVPVVSVIDGCAASAATIMSVVAQERYINEHAFMLIHQLSSGMWGNYESLKDDMENCDLLMETIRNIYTEHTKIPKKTLNQILKRDLWFDADICLKYGLIDEII